MGNDIAYLQEIISGSENIVFFGGAGVSTESGIPDFRSCDGLYSQHYKYPPETILSRTFFNSHKEEFYRFYRENILILDCLPNSAHLKLAELEAAGRLKAVITQNIDGLHQAAGSKNVIELHGSIHRNYCMGCGRQYDAQFMLSGNIIPVCGCGGHIRPDVVLYEESLDYDMLESAVKYISEADVLIIGGTSLVVYPAAGLLSYYKGSKLVLINKSPTGRDAQANLLISGGIAGVMEKITV